jgi:hypothetical protein
MTAKHPQALDLKRKADILIKEAAIQRKILRNKEDELKEVKLAVIKHFHGVTVGSTVIYKGNEYKVTKVDTCTWDYPFMYSRACPPVIQIRMGNEYPWLYGSVEWKLKPEQTT